MIRAAFNWLATKPSSQYTFGGDHNSFPMNRAGRLTERVVSVPKMVIGAGAMVLAIPAAVLGAVPAAVVLATGGALAIGFSKAAGLICGGVAHLGAKVASSFVNHVTRDPNAPPKHAVPQIMPLQR